MNTPAIFYALQVLPKPHLILPHHTIPTFAHLPFPISSAFNQQSRKPDIKAIVLDKDNCFATSNTNTIHESYASTFARLKAAYPPQNILIVSNSAGLASKDPDYAHAAAVTANTGVAVLRHSAPKPSAACAEEVLAYFRENAGVTSGSEIAVVGDRLFTDTLLAKRMGAWSIWIKEGVVKDEGLVTKLEYALSSMLWRRGVNARVPGDDTR